MNPRIIFGKTFEFLNSRFGFKRSVQHKDPKDTAKIESQRHGTYYVSYVSAEKSREEVYNVPNEKNVQDDGVDKKYVWCDVPVWKKWQVEDRNKI